MFSKDWKKEVLTIPNLLSLLRLFLIPVYVVIYLKASKPSDFLAAGSVLALSCLTDMIDGKIARRYNLITTVGKVLDPFADKATQFAITICLSKKYPILCPILSLFIVKELFQLVACILAFLKGKALPGALWAGKVCTTVLFISFITLVLFPNLASFYVTLIAAVDFIFLLISFLSYILAYYGKNTKVQDLRQA